MKDIWSSAIGSRTKDRRGGLTFLLQVALVMCFSFAGCSCNKASTVTSPQRLFDELKDSDVVKRRTAAESLVELAAQSIPPPGILQTADNRSSQQFIWDHVCEFLEIIKNPTQDAEVRGSLVRAIALVSETRRMNSLEFKLEQHYVKELALILVDEAEHEHVRSWIAMVLPDIGEAEIVAPAILLASGCKNKNVRVNASQALGRLELEANVVLAWAQRAMVDPTPQVRVMATSMAARFAKENEIALHILLLALNDNEQSVRHIAAIMISTLNIGQSKDLEATLQELLGHDDPVIRVHSAVALMRLSETPAPHIRIPMRLLEGDSADLRAEAARALVGAGSLATGAVPLLTKLLRDPDEKVRICAAFSLISLNGKKDNYVEVLQKGAKSQNEEVRMWSLGFLIRSGEKDVTGAQH